MSIWVLCLAGFVLSIPLLFKSYEHEWFRERYGQERGDRLAERLGLVSGYLYFGFWIGLWIAPQEHFAVRITNLQDIVFPLYILGDLSMPMEHFIIGLLFIVPGAWLGIKGVMDVTLRVAEFHRPDHVVTTGIYQHIRHPQYLGGVLSHLAMTFFLSGLFSLIVTPVIVVINFVIARKEEKELVREFGEEYEKYREQVPMFVPRWKRERRQE